MRDFFSTKIGYQTLAFIVTLVSFPFLYLGGSQSNSSLLNVGLALMLLGMLAVPVIKFTYRKKPAKKEVYKGVRKLETREE